MRTHPTLFAHAVSAAPVKIRRTARFGEAFEAIVRNCLAQVHGNVPGVLAGDIESLHQMRVGVRRLRALLSAAQSWDPMPEGTAGKLRWFGVELGRARNWDVFLESTLPGLGGSSQPVEAMARELAHKQHVHIEHLLQGPRCKALMEELALWSTERLWRDPARIQPWDKDARKVSKALLRRARERVAGRARRLDTARAESLHRLRIAVKKERYLREFFGSSSRSQVLADAQEVLGRMNDSRVARDLLRTLEDHLPAHTAELSFLEGVLAGQQDECLPKAIRFARRKL
ncbi:CHAD domain-containing protein [Massilia eburnea]|nr:CHAD domain-containing protein [Massilia eburnea]